MDTEPKPLTPLFWLLWSLATLVGLGLGYVLFFIWALIITGAHAYLLGGRALSNGLWLAIGGLPCGLLLGLLQSLVLATKKLAGRWFLISLIIWPLGFLVSWHLLRAFQDGWDGLTRAGVLAGSASAIEGQVLTWCFLVAGGLSVVVQSVVFERRGVGSLGWLLTGQAALLALMFVLKGLLYSAANWLGEWLAFAAAAALTLWLLKFVGPRLIQRSARLQTWGLPLGLLAVWLASLAAHGLARAIDPYPFLEPAAIAKVGANMVAYVPQAGFQEQYAYQAPGYRQVSLGAADSAYTIHLHQNDFINVLGPLWQTQMQHNLISRLASRKYYPVSEYAAAGTVTWQIRGAPVTLTSYDAVTIKGERVRILAGFFPGRRGPVLLTVEGPAGAWEPQAEYFVGTWR